MGVFHVNDSQHAKQIRMFGNRGCANMLQETSVLMIRAQITQRTNKMDAKDQNGFSYSGQKIRNAIFLVFIKSQDKISECLENFIICGFCGIISIFR